MFKNNLKIAYRNLMSHKGFSFINIFGLALGTACCLYILLYVKDEFGYDEHHAAADRIYRITSILGAKDDLFPMATCSGPIPMAMKRDFPEVEKATRIVGMFGEAQQVFHYQGKDFYETGGAFADSTLFQIFSYHFVHGSPYRALSAPYTIVLTEPMARKYFGTADPIGKVLEIEMEQARQKFKVTGVINNQLGKSHLDFNFFVSMPSGGLGSYVLSSDEWSGNNFTNAYVKLRPNTLVPQLEAKLPAFLEKYAGDQLRQRNMKKILRLQAVTQIHTTTGFAAEPTKPVSSKSLFLLLGIAALIQAIACINFMNLSTARAAKRAREIGVRKVIGAQRKALVGQFLGESMLIAFFAMIVAVPLVIWALPYLNQMTGVELSYAFLQKPQVWLGILLIGLLTGLLAGSYPALYLSGFQPINALKAKVLSTGNNWNLRQALVVFQFVLAITLIVSVVVIHAQMNFIAQQDLGYNPKQKIVIPFYTNDALQNAEAYRNAIKQLPGVERVSRANNYPSQDVINDLKFYKDGGNMDASQNIRFMFVDDQFLPTLEMKLLAGRNFWPNDSLGGVIVNETTLRILNIPLDAAIGQHLHSDISATEKYDLEIVGVMKNFNFSSLYQEVTPFLLMNDNNRNGRLSQMILNTHTSDVKQLLTKLEAIWKKQVSSLPFEYVFIEDELQEQYAADRRLFSIINGFTGLAILISCLGLLGLAMFTAERRTKEIGIRKVLGASIFDITTLISAEFLKLVVIAMLIATPLAWWAMAQWLKDFAYRVEIQWWMFVLAGLAALIAALATVGFQSVRAAMVNPVKSLKTE